jgi:AraC family transcriptional regulator of adaptative response / DNA-3-methyladenine glycosylase II
MNQDTTQIFARALDARDPRFDGVFFVGIITTRIYCRPVCPARVAYHDHRRFFNTAAAAERAGFRPCLRCRPELAPGLAVVDAVSRLAQGAAQRISAGALNGRSVAALAGEFGVSERHLRRALEREVGVSPSELAQTHRLLLAKRLLVDTTLPITRIAYASGFQSLRRFNAAFRDQYRMSPSDLRKSPGVRRSTPAAPGADESLRLTLAYREPFDWDSLLSVFRAERIPGVELATERRYSRTIRIDGKAGVISAEPGPNGHLVVELSAPLIPALMPLIALIRRLFDLDAEPAVVDAHLAQGGLGALVRKRPGMRIPGAVDGFEIALRGVLGGLRSARPNDNILITRVTEALGETFDSGIPGLTHLAPTAQQIAEAGTGTLVELGVPARRAAALTTIATELVEGRLRLEPGGDVPVIREALLAIDGMDETIATAILMRSLYWPDAFPARDPGLQRALGLTSTRALTERAERWRPWRAYAAQHLSWR